MKPEYLAIQITFHEAKRLLAMLHSCNNPADDELVQELIAALDDAATADDPE
jgi:hypothetical protein